MTRPIRHLHKTTACIALNRRSFIAGTALGLAGLSAPPLAAAPVRYRLDASRSTVGFSYTFQGTRTSGTMPVRAANVDLDLDNVPRSRADVTLDPSKANAGFAFATQTMQSASVLDTATHPTIRFVTTSFDGDLSGATVSGNLTVKGQTRPVTLNANLFRQRGTEAGDRSKLSVLLEGEIDRRDFGADGWASFVGPMIELRVLVRLDRA